MGKNKAAAEKKLKKAAKEAVASGREIKRERNDLKRKANQVPDRLVSFKTIHYLDEPDVENLDAIRKSLIEKLQATQRVNERFKRDLVRLNGTQKMINQLLEAQAQTHTQMMRDQQAHQEQQLILHQQLQDAMNQLASQQPVEQQRDTERRVEGLSMPAYHGHLNESIGLYIHRMRKDPPPAPPESNESADMEVDNINVRKARKKDRSKLRCFNCQGFGHFAAACQKPKKKISGDGPPGKQNNLEVEEAPSDKDVEYITFGAMEENGAEGVAVSKAQVGRSPESGRAPLMIKSGVINGKVVKILIDSGATNSLCRVGLGKHVIRSKAVRISGYDGLMSPLTETRELKETVQIGTFTFHDTQLTEWDLKDKAFDVILGQPWFKKHNPWMSMRRLLNHQDGS
ncbi:hypothetical protein DYB30_010713 [Aphanomyces astaci]|uniref:CCHC-type domain-containing protein n=2 Tax=Aphanomyces astaci TaxID=112090 RepID=A0A397CS06_APHAT|nr:hypothetical protein DYB30_010713 [Aphanomyces astaci]